MPQDLTQVVPDVPAVTESGWKDFEVVSTFGVLVPAGTPADIAGRLNAELAKIVQNAEVTEQMLQQGVYALPPQTLPQASERLRAEVAKWEKVINEAGIKSDN